MNRDFFDKVAAAGSEKIKERDYWLSQLVGQLEKTTFPYDYKKKDSQKQNFDQVEFEMSSHIYDGLMKLANNSTPLLHMLLTAGIVVLLNKYTGRRDIIVGAPIYRQDIEGEFINTVLVLRNYIHQNMTFKELLLQVRQTLRDAAENQNYALDTLLYKLNIPLRENHDFPLFDTAVLLENIHDKDYLRHIRINLEFLFSWKQERIKAILEYNTASYKKTTVQRIWGHYVHVLHQCLTAVSTDIEDIDLLTGEEKQRLLTEFNRTGQSYAREKIISVLFQEQAEKTADRLALEMEGTALTYRELNRQSNQWAHLLRRKSVGPGTVTGIMMERSLEIIIGIIAILKSGGAYFPLDPMLPENRVVTMLEDAGVPLVLTKTGTIEKYSYTGLKNRQVHTLPRVTAPRGQVLDLDRLPFPDRSLIDYEKYHQDIGQAMVKNAMTLQATRGCPYNCAYCHKIWPKRHVFRSAENIYEEIKLYYDMGVRRFSFVDDIFNLDIKNSARFFKLIIQNRLDVQMFFPSGLRTDILTRDYIDLMVEAGTVSLAMALETASPRLQKLIGKNLDIDKFRENIEYICDKYPNVLSELFTMHGFPTETEEEAIMTLDFIKRLKWVHFPYINILKIYPNTRMEKLALDSGISREAIIRSEKYYHHEFSDSLPFDKAFTLKYQTQLLQDYFLSKERLLHVMPFQMKALSEEELILKYNSYLPAPIKTMIHLLNYIGICEEELGVRAQENSYSQPVPHLNEKIREYFPAQNSLEDAFRVLLLDLSQPFSHERIAQYDVVEAPLGLMNLVTSLHREYGSRINGKIAKSRIDFDSFQELKTLIERFKPGLIGIRTLILFKDFFHKTTAMIRHWGYTGPIVTGGPYATSSYTGILQDPNIDLAILGEGEVTFNELIGKMLEAGKRLPLREILEKIPGLAFILQEKNTIASREILEADQLDKLLSGQPGQNPVQINSPTDLAYVISTSGSTGKSKGVMISHRNVHNLVIGLNERVHQWYNRELKVGLVAPFVFDASVKQIFGALLQGHCLCIVPECIRGDGDELIKFYNTRQIDISDGTPTLIRLFLESVTGNHQSINLQVKHFLIGGEALSLRLVEDFIHRFSGQSNPAPVITNVYGPSECTVDATFHKITGENLHLYDAIPIGKPMSNVKIYILDKATRLLPIGIWGEIYISGDGIGQGYLNRPELTFERFIDFNRSHLSYTSYIYRTGDLGRWLPDGNIEFSGRIDHQTKIRGYRVELGEIEIQLSRHKSVKEAVVIVREDKVGDKYLCAYFIPDYTIHPPGREVNIPGLKHYLTGELPEYMIPSHFVQLERIPVNKNGKIDRKALPDPDIGTGQGYVAPRDSTEQVLADIWTRVLGIEKQVIGIDDNFFELGGHSLKATILISRIHKTCDIKIPLAEIFKSPYIRGLAQYIRKANEKKIVSIAAVPKKEYYPLSSAMKRLYFEQQMNLESTTYVISAAVVLEGELDRQRLVQSFKKLIQRHESLRTYFEIMENEPVQRIHDKVEFEIEYKEVEVEESEGTGGLAPLLRNFIRPFDLSQAPLLKVGLVKTGKTEHILIVNVHHMSADGTSLGLLINDFSALYDGKELLPQRLQYKDYCQWENTMVREETEFIKKQEKFWLDQFKGEIPVLNLPVDFPRPKVKSSEGAVKRSMIDSETLKRLKQLAVEEEISLYMVILAIYNILLSKLSGQEDIIVGTPNAGRGHPDLEPIIGMIVNTTTLRNYPSADKTVKAFLHEIKQNTLQAFENQDYKFEKLVEQVLVNKDLGRSPLFDVFFAFQNMEMPELQITGLKLKPYEYESHVSRFDMGFHVYEAGNRLVVLVEYCSRLLREETIDMFVENFKEITAAVLGDRNIQLADIEISGALEPVETAVPSMDLGF
jgi:amino acid adenylation domain-containing protein